MFEILRKFGLKFRDRIIIHKHHGDKTRTQPVTALIVEEAMKVETKSETTLKKITMLSFADYSLAAEK